jgi:hypothetical protein
VNISIDFLCALGEYVTPSSIFIIIVIVIVIVIIMCSFDAHLFIVLRAYTCQWVPLNIHVETFEVLDTILHIVGDWIHPKTFALMLEHLLDINTTKCKTQKEVEQTVRNIILHPSSMVRVHLSLSIIQMVFGYCWVS